MKFAQFYEETTTSKMKYIWETLIDIITNGKKKLLNRKQNKYEVKRAKHSFCKMSIENKV